MPVRTITKEIDGRTVIRFMADFVDQNGRRHRPGYKTQKEAKARLLKAESQVRDGTFSAGAGKMTVQAAASLYTEHLKGRVARRELDEMTVDCAERHIDLYICATRDPIRKARGAKSVRFSSPIGQIKLIRLTQVHLQEFREKLLDCGLSRATAKGIMQTASTMFEWLKF